MGVNVHYYLLKIQGRVVGWKRDVAGCVKWIPKGAPYYYNKPICFETQEYINLMIVPLKIRRAGRRK